MCRFRCWTWGPASLTAVEKGGNKDRGKVRERNLVGGLEHVLFFHSVVNVFIPTDFHSIIFQRGRAQPPTINFAATLDSAVGNRFGCVGTAVQSLLAKRLVPGHVRRRFQRCNKDAVFLSLNKCNWISAWPVPQALPTVPANCSASETGFGCRFGSAAISLKNWIAASLCKRHWIGSILCHRIMSKKLEIRCYFDTWKISCIPSISQLLFPSSLMISSLGGSSHCFESLVNKSPNWVIACITGPTSPIFLLTSENQ